MKFEDLKPWQKVTAIGVAVVVFIPWAMLYALGWFVGMSISPLQEGFKKGLG